MYNLDGFAMTKSYQDGGLIIGFVKKTRVGKIINLYIHICALLCAHKENANIK